MSKRIWDPGIYRRHAPGGCGSWVGSFTFDEKLSEDW